MNQVKSIAMNEFLPDRPATDKGRIFSADFIACLNGRPQTSADSFATAVALAHAFRPRNAWQDISIYEVRTRIHYDLDLAVVMTCRRMWDDLFAS